MRKPATCASERANPPVAAALLEQLVARASLRRQLAQKCCDRQVIGWRSQRS